MADYNGLVPASLQPWARTSSQPTSFANVLGRIYNERGHFRHITEAQLRDEIATNAISGALDPSDSDSDDADPKDGSSLERGSRTEQLLSARREVIEQIASAQNEALFALDLGDYLFQLQDIARARRPFCTSEGTLGIGPSTMAPGDLLYVLVGANVPHILRSDDHGRLQIVGEAYANGIMDGEVLEDSKPPDVIVIH